MTTYGPVRLRTLKRFAAAAMVICSIGAARGVLAQTSEVEPGDVVFRDGFEQWRDANQRLESSWRPWSRSACDVVWEGDPRDVCLSPEYKQANPMGLYPYRVHGGSNAQQYFTLYASHHAGVLKGFDADPGAVVEVHAWGQAWSSQQDDPRESDPAADVRMRIGVDPEGGSDPMAPSVVWGASANPLDAWGEVPPVEVTVGKGGRVTVFLSSSPKYALKHNDMYWDDVYAVLVAEPGPDLPAAGAGNTDDEVAGNPAPAATPVDPILAGMVESGARPGNGGGAGWQWLAGVLGAGIAVMALDRKE